MSQKRSSHTDRVLKGLSKKASGATQSQKLNSLRDQYEVIRDDVVKLRKDLQKGYDMAKSTVEKKGFLRELFSSR